MTKKTIFCGLLFLFHFLLWIPASASADGQPNIIHILVDDMGWNDVSYHGSEIKTPGMDRLAKGGAELNQFYVQPTCTPTRAAMMTGRYPLRFGLHRFVLRPWHTSSLPLDEVTIAQQLKQFGYTTAICGKWHLGMHKKEQCPLARGFDFQYGHLGGHLNYLDHTYDHGLDWHRNEIALTETGYTTELIADEAIRLVKAHKGKRPLYLYLSFNAPHLPLQSPQNWRDQFALLQPDSRAKYAAMVGCLDHHIGRVLETIETTKSFKNTLIIFSSDNGGGATGTHGADNLPLKGMKGTLYEGGVRVPAIASWRGVISPGQKINLPMHAVDLFPTMVAAAGNQVPESLELDGVNLLPAWLGENTDLDQREIVLNAMGDSAAIRSGEWKLLKNGSYKESGEADVFELYNIKTDPNEEDNLSSKFPVKLAELKQRIVFWNLQQQNIPELMVKMKPEAFKAPKVWKPLPSENDLQSSILKKLEGSTAKIDTVEVYGVRVDAERRFSYKVEHYREHLFIRVAAGQHSGWAEINLGENTNSLPFERRVWRTKWMSKLKGQTLAEAIESIISQRTVVDYGNTEAAEMALLDLAGKCLNVPTIELLELEKREPVPGLYAILSDDPEKVRQEAQRALEQNLKTHLKVKLYGDRDTDVVVIQAARSIFGESAFIIGDVNTGYRRDFNGSAKIDDLVPYMNALHEAGLTCVEDPANLSNVQWIALAKASEPLLFCPDVPTRPAWKSIRELKPEMGQVFNMHPAGMGSLIETARLGHWIQSHKKNLMVGDSSLVGPACSAWEQIAIGLGADWVEAIEKPQENDVFQQCVTENPVRRSDDGRFELPVPSPGFGVEIDLKKLRSKSYAFLEL